jgi:hypothetical protein
MKSKYLYLNRLCLYQFWIYLIKIHIQESQIQLIKISKKLEKKLQII